MSESVKKMLKLLSTAFRKDPDSNNYKIIAIIASGFDELKKVLEDVRKAHFVETASGKSLDYIAKLFNVTRQQGESDEDLRARLFVEFKKYLSCGTKDDILQVVKFYAKLRDDDYRNIPFIPDNLFILEPEPAHFVVVVPILNTYDEELRCKLYSEEFRAWFKEKLQYIVDQVKAGGVKGDVLILYPKSSGFDNQGLSSAKAFAHGYVKSESYDNQGLAVAQVNAIDWMPSAESYDNQGFVGVLAIVLLEKVTSCDNMGLVESTSQAMLEKTEISDNMSLNKSEAQAIVEKTNSYDGMSLVSSKAKLFVLKNNTFKGGVGSSYFPSKIITCDGPAHFTKLTVNAFCCTSCPVRANVKVTYTVNGEEEITILEETGITLNPSKTFVKDLDIVINANERIMFKLYMGTFDEGGVCNDLFEVEGHYP